MNALPQTVMVQTRERLFQELMDCAAGHPNDETFACIFASWRSGGGALPAWLGLDGESFGALLAFHFPGYRLEVPADDRADVPAQREGEYAELISLLLSHRAGESVSEAWMAGIVAAACMASDHLWQDLGLWNRAQLSALMQRNFPALAARNVKDMKWKKFLYKQLCDAEGIYVCRSPSCEVCADYANCFGPEE